MSVPPAITRTSAQKVFKGSRSLDFISNTTKSSSLSPQISDQNESIDILNQQPKSAQVPLLYTSKPVHPFLRYSEPSRLRRVVTRFRDVNSLLVSQKFSSDNENAVIVHDLNRPSSTHMALEFVRKTHDFVQLEQLKDVLFESDVDITGFDIEVKISILDEVANKPDGDYATNEEKMIYLLKKKWDINKYPVFENLVNKYFDISGSVQSSKLIFLAFADQLVNEPQIDFKSLEAIVNSLDYHYPDLSNDHDIVYSCLRLFSKSETELPTQQSLTHRLQSLGCSPSTTVFNSLLKVISLNPKPRQNLELLVGLDDVLYTSSDGTSVKYLLHWAKSVDELVSLLNLIDKKFSLEERKNEYPKFADEFTRFLLHRFPLLSPAVKFELLKRVKTNTALSLETESLILEDTVSSGSFILATALYKQLKDSVNKDKLRDLALNRQLNTEHGRTGFSNSYRNHFLETLEQ